VKLRINIAVSVLALLTIAAELRAMSVLEERRTDAYLQRQFENLNQKFFNGELPPTTVVWADINYFGLTTPYDNGSFVIEVDRRRNFLHTDELSDTIRHKLCHVATDQEEEGLHGPACSACMRRIAQK